MGRREAEATVAPLANIVKEVRRGNVQEARRLLVNHLKSRHDDVEAWYLLSRLASKPEEQARALQYMLRLAPGDERALRRLASLQNGEQSSSPPSTEVASDTYEAEGASGEASGSRLETQPYPSPSGGIAKIREPINEYDAKAASTRALGLSEREWQEIAYEILDEQFQEPKLRDAASPEPVEIFFEDVVQLPIISSTGQQLWLGAQMLAPTRLKALKEPRDGHILAEAIAACRAHLENLCAEEDVRTPHVRRWIQELRLARTDIYALKRSKIRRFLQRLRSTRSTEELQEFETSIFELIELLCLLPDSALRALGEKRDESKILSADIIATCLESTSTDSASTISEHAQHQRTTAIQALALGYLRYGLRVASKYVGQGLDYSDLVQEAYLGLLRGASRFNYREYRQFGHYGTSWIWQGVTRAIADQARSVRLPVHRLEEINQLTKAEREHATGHCRLYEDLAVYVALDLLTADEANEIKAAGTLDALTGKLKTRYLQGQQKIKTWQALREWPQSLDDPRLQRPRPGAYCEMEFDTPFGGWADESVVHLDSRIAESELRRDLLEMLQLVIHSERDYHMICMRYGLDDGDEKTLQEVGDAVGLTRERVRQIESRALGKLKSKLLQRPGLARSLEAAWLDSWLINAARLQLPSLDSSLSTDIEEREISLQKKRLQQLIDGLPRGSWRRHPTGLTREEQLYEALNSLGSVAHYEEICEALDDEDPSISSTSAYAVLTTSSDRFVPLGEGYFSLMEWERARSREEEPILPYCPQPLPDPPDYQDSFFEAVLIARNKLRKRPLTVGSLIDEMVAWAQVSEDVPGWRKQSYLSALYAIGLIPFSLFWGNENRILRSTLPALPIRELRSYCLRTLTSRVGDITKCCGLG